MAVEIIEGCTYTDKYTVPVQDDDGDEFGESIEDFMKRMAAHSHDNITSNPIGVNINKDETILNVSEPTEISWVNDGNGNMYTIVNAAVGSTKLSNNFRKYYIGSEAGETWEEFNPKITWLTDTTYRLYSNINDKDIKVYTI